MLAPLLRAEQLFLLHMLLPPQLMTAAPTLRLCLQPQATPLLPESRSFSVLQKREREVDELVARKRRAIREAGHDARLQNKKLRVCVHSQAMNQPKASGQRGSGRSLPL